MLQFGQCYIKCQTQMWLVRLFLRHPVYSSYIRSLEALIHSFNCHFQEYEQCRQHWKLMQNWWYSSCSNWLRATRLAVGAYRSPDSMRDTFRDTTLLAFNKSLFQQHTSVNLWGDALVQTKMFESTFGSSTKVAWAAPFVPLLSAL